MTKNLRTIAAVLMMASLCLCLTAKGETEVVDGISWSYKIVDSEACLLGYSPEGAETLVIPQYLGRVPVTEIGEAVFLNQTQLKNVSLPAKLTTIGKFAFENCTSLDCITFPIGLKRIGRGAFSGCASFSSLDIPDSVIEIDDMAFSKCTGLKNIFLPDNVTSLGGGAFGGCSNLTSIRLPKDLEVISSALFSGCSKLSSITIPESVKALESIAFENCASLTAIHIPFNVSEIQDQAFKGCSNLVSVKIDNPSVCVESSAFDDCDAVQEVFFSNGLPSKSFAFGNANPVIYVGNPLGSYWNSYKIVNSGTPGQVLMLNEDGSATWQTPPTSADTSVRGIDLITGWNLVPLPPVELADSTKQALRDTSKIYTYNPENQAYVEDNSLLPNHSYWIHADRDFSIRFAYKAGE